MSSFIRDLRLSVQNLFPSTSQGHRTAVQSSKQGTLRQAGVQDVQEQGLPRAKDSRSYSPEGCFSLVAKRSSIHCKVVVGKTHNLSVNCTAPLMFRYKVRFVLRLQVATIQTSSVSLDWFPVKCFVLN